MATILYIGDTAGDQLIITENGKFSIETRVHTNEMGFPDTNETFIEIEGDVTQDGTLNQTAIGLTPDAVYAAIETINQQTANGQSPRRFYVTVDGVTRFDFPPSECINSPIVTNFSTIDGLGAGDTHWKYRLTIYIKQLARTDGVLSFTSSITTTSIQTEENGVRPIRKHWVASCQGVDVQTAYNFIVSLAPSAPTLTTTYARYFQEARATGDWLWDYEQNRKIEEDITVTGLGPSYVASTQVSADGTDAMPLIHRSPRAAIVVVLNGVVSSTNPSLAVQPELHWSEGGGVFSDQGGLFHDLGNEQVGERVIFDDLKGIYRLKYQERWIGTFYTIPNHHDHTTIPVISEPADGPIAGINR